MTLPIHHLDIDVVGCLARVEINGFPACTIGGEKPSAFTPPISIHLIGKDNAMRIVLEQYDGSPGGSLRAVQLSGAVRRYEKGDMVEPGVGEEVAPIGLPSVLVDQLELADMPLPVPLDIRFDNEGPGFGRRLLTAEIHDDEAARLRYAIAIRDWFLANDTAQLAAATAPKREDWALAFGVDEAALLAEMNAAMPRIMAAGIEPFEVADVEQESYCGGRIWKLQRTGGQPLVATPYDEEQRRWFTEIFVGVVDGELRIVR